jgi:hypothetical protein
MTKNLLFLLLFFFCSLAYSQKTLENSFEIKENSSSYSSAFITTSFLNANMENYRLRNERVKLVFENGFSIELFSAKELFIQGRLSNISDYAEEQAQNVPGRIFGMTPQGHITVGVQNKIHPKSIKK